jgi:uncharacterized protein YkwD
MTIRELDFSRVIIALVTSIILWSCSTNEDSITPNVNLKTELLAAINQLRIDGCQCANDFMPPVNVLRWNDTLQKAAENHASDMYWNGYFSHLSRDGRPPITRAMQAGYEGEYVGENIARNYTNIKDVVEGWKASESHCKAMMDTLYNEMGAAQMGGYWVLDLGRAR